MIGTYWLFQWRIQVFHIKAQFPLPDHNYYFSISSKWRFSVVVYHPETDTEPTQWSGQGMASHRPGLFVYRKEPLLPATITKVMHIHTCGLALNTISHPHHMTLIGERPFCVGNFNANNWRHSFSAIAKKNWIIWSRLVVVLDVQIIYSTAPVLTIEVCLLAVLWRKEKCV